MSCAIITGASRGIGKAIALKLANMGLNIVVNHRNDEQNAQDTVNEIKKLGVEAVCFKCDVSSFEQTKEMMDFAITAFDSIDVLVNNAGITKDTLLMRMSESDFDAVIDVNLKGTFNCTKHAVKYMSKAKYGKIINISSVVGEIGNFGQSNYSASKAGIIGFTKSVAKEVASRNITVNCVAPGFIETDMTAVLSEEIKNNMLGNIPCKKFGDVTDVANCVGFLACDDSKYITGQVLNVCGGMVM